MKAEDLLNLTTSIDEDYLCVSYEIYCEALDLVGTDTLTEEFFVEHFSEGFLDSLKKISLPKKLFGLFKSTKKSMSEIAKNFGASLPDIISAFKQRDIFALLRTFKFSFKLILKALGTLTGLVRDGLMSVFEEIVNSKVIQKVRSGAMKVDEFMDKYPLLKKVTGIAVAGLLVFIWLNMSFMGDIEFDMNLGDIAAALKGSFSLTDLFLSPSGLMMITLLGTGMMGFGAPWLGKTAYNIVLAVTYTGLGKLKKSPKISNLMQKMRRKIGR